MAFDPYHKWLGIPPEKQSPRVTERDNVKGERTGSVVFLLFFCAFYYLISWDDFQLEVARSHLSYESFLNKAGINPAIEQTRLNRYPASVFIFTYFWIFLKHSIIPAIFTFGVFMLAAVFVDIWKNRSLE